ncbi:disease resistance protein RPM1-like [Mangifera indica]|uniref:disease resistance protein RPM1-like n=1 Tax=Mangifera indica TaxID=29780 RepID=UPI001CFB2B0D|nr:disease resistance protein RPM1-like [Mangifera indica]
MAETAVKFVLDKLTPFFSNEVQMMNGVHEEVVYVRTELERMKVFLRSADCLEETDEEVKIWVKQIRDVAHDIEDVLDEFTLLLTHNHGDGFYGFLHKLSCCVKNTKARYRIAYEIQGINSRIKSIDEGQLRLRKKFRAAKQAGSSLANSWNDRRGDALLLDKTDLVAIDGPKEKVAELLVGGGLGRQVVSLAGMGGMGKTTLAKQVYEDRQVKKHFTIRAWITVSRSFKMEEVFKDMLKQLFQAVRKSVPKAVEAMSSDGLKKIIKEFLQQRRYLIVLDDVWHINDWDAVKYALPTNNCGSRVMLTTRKVDLAFTSRLESAGWVYNLQPIPPEESWILFCIKTFHGKACPPHLEGICRCILKKCEGLPLAIVAIGGVLAAKDRRRIDEWEMVHRSLGAEIDGNDKLQNLKKVLSLSLNDLPCHLKACFLYLSIFPENHLIEPMRLVRLWTAEGFVEAKEGKTVEEVAQEYLSELLNRSLMQVVGTTSDGRVKACRIHDFLREIIKTKSREHNISAIAKEHMNQNTLWPDKVRRLSVHNTLQNVQQNRFANASQLRSLFMFGMDEKPRLHALFPSGFKLLGVLDMRGTPVTKFPIEVMNLYYLKYLSLRDTKLKTIPRYIGKLQNLETLDLKHAYVTELPSEILNLKKLRHLMVYRYEYETFTAFKYGFKSIEKIGVLQSLQKLSFIEANHVGTLQELGKLTQLKRLGIIKLRKQDGKMLCSSIEHLTNLRALSITSTEESEIIDLQHLHHPPQLLQRIYLVGRLESFPHWITNVHSLVKVYLRWSRLKENPLVFLQDLPNLVHLELLQVYDGDMLCFMAGGFKKLKQLGLEKCEGLRFVEIQKGAMPCIEKLRIQWCKSLQKVPLGIEHLSQLKMVEFFDLPHKLLKTIRRDEGGEDYWRVAHIPKVNSTYWIDGRWEVYVRFHQDEQLKPINVEGLVMSYKITREISLGL